MTSVRITVVLLCCFALTACISIPKDAKNRLDRPPSCSTARSDVATLDADKNSGGRRVVTLVPAILPFSIVIGIVRQIFRSPPGAYTDHWRVIAGSNNRAVDTKVAEIERECGL